LPSEIYGVDNRNGSQGKQNDFSGDPPLLHVRLYQQLAEKLVTANSDLAGIRALEAQQSRDYEEVKRQLQALSLTEAKFSELKRAVNQSEIYLESLSRKAIEAEINNAWKASEGTSSAQIFESATPPEKPVSPRKMAAVIFTMLSILCGLGVCVYLYAQKVSSRATAARAFGEGDSRIGLKVDVLRRA
jgi:uncharacterized protein involved in exopolysaccharide biosynthesis